MWLPASYGLPEDVQIGRYTVAHAAVKSEVAFPLLQLVKIQFGAKTKTVLDAVQDVLTDTGYRLTSEANRDPCSAAMLRAPLPRIQRTMGPIRIVEALRALGGPGFELIVDPIHRLVTLDAAHHYLINEASVPWKDPQTR
jgi:conjugative transfer region protein (TIGR03748 family)